MPRPVVCPHCREELDIPAEFRGRQVRCAACQQVFVPPAEPAGPPPLPAPGNWEEDRPSRRPARDDDLPARRPVRDAADRLADLDDDRAPWDDRPRRPKKRGNLWVWLLVLGVIGLCVLPCGGFVLFAVWVAFPNFQPHDSPAGRYRAEFPGQPFTYTRPDGDRTWHCTEFKRSLPPETYYVHYTDLTRPQAQRPDRELKAAADKSVSRVVGSREVRRTSGVTDGYPSVELTVSHPDDSVTSARFLLVGTRLYEVGVTGLIDAADATADPRVRHFQDAFKVQTPVEAK
jgi:LSD1 subclass zinc finger protein